MEGGFYEIQKKMVGRHSIRRDDDDIHAGICVCRGGSGRRGWRRRSLDGEKCHGTVKGTYEELQDAVDNADNDSTIVLNKDATGNGCEINGQDANWDRTYTLDFNGHTYSVINGIKTDITSKSAAIYENHENMSSALVLKNGTLKVANCTIGVKWGSYSVTLANFNINASDSVDCKCALYVDGDFKITGNSGIKVQPGNDAIDAEKDWVNNTYSTIDTTGKIQGNITFHGEPIMGRVRVIIKNGSFEVAFKNAFEPAADEEEDDYSYVWIQGGTFTQNPGTEYVGKNFLVKDNGDGTYTVEPTEECKSLLQEFAELKKEASGLQAEFDQDTKSIDAEMNLVKEKIESAESELNQGIDEVGIEKALENAEKNVGEARAAMEELQTEISEKAEYYGPKGSSIEERCGNLLDRFTDMDMDLEKEEVENLSSTANNISSAFRSDKNEEEENGYYQSAWNKLNQKLKNVESDVRVLRANYDRDKAEAENQATKEALDAANKRLEEANAALLEAKKNQEELSKKVDELQTSLKETKDQLNKAEGDLKNQEELTNRIEELQNSLKETKEQLVKAEEELKKQEELTNKIKALEGSLEETKRQLAKAENEQTGLKEKNEELQKSLEETKKQLEKTREEMAGKIEELQSSLNETKEQLAKAEEKLKEQENLKKKNEELQKSLEETKNQLVKAEEELKKQDELNKKLEDLENSLKETQDKLKKAEAQLKNSPVKKPGQVKGLKLKAGKKKVTVTYKKVSGATSYKVTYSTSKKFKKAKTVTVKSGKTVKKTISKLKSKKRYYVKVCAVKKVKGKNYTGKWSASKSVKVK